MMLRLRSARRRTLEIDANRAWGHHRRAGPVASRVHPLGQGGPWEIGCREGSGRSGTPNMVFFGNHLLLASTVANRESFLTLDTVQRRLI
jgi:hypothetical protein